MICERAISHWLSKVILRTCSDECKLIYRKFEKLKIRITRFHLQFNLACIYNDLLPTYTNLKIMLKTKIISHCSPQSVQNSLVRIKF